MIPTDVSNLSCSTTVCNVNDHIFLQTFSLFNWNGRQVQENIEDNQARERDGELTYKADSTDFQSINNKVSLFQSQSYTRSTKARNCRKMSGYQYCNIRPGQLKGAKSVYSEGRESIRKMRTTGIVDRGKGAMVKSDE